MKYGYNETERIRLTFQFLMGTGYVWIWIERMGANSSE